MRDPMRDLNGSKRKRIAAGVIGLILLVIVLFSAFYITAETGHDCIGEDCPVCSFIQQCESTLRGVGDGTAVQSAILIPFLFVLVIAAPAAAAVCPDTLISIKVRLND